MCCSGWTVVTLIHLRDSDLFYVAEICISADPVHSSVCYCARISVCFTELGRADGRLL